ncbi:hypothetical protein Poli38472_004662 [Pythium oligandrum]|uniref:EF-hand domain-containing protein n=1 Tax=Pythium oligandrum TaxID=41045 RepID=A0A8K1FIC2_PYTOL|nr:hypothetical protein Poli38472_004662 [Pythium oligandrum]|eukprot:TMW59593.1 hypothetical protein Poli38472_004662 [Pythium oligandrum]
MSNRGKRRSATVFSRDEIGVEQLQSLKEKFADGDLNEKEFVSLFREIIDASLSETQLTELFQKIDANSDGTVDWDELTNYMFLSGSDNSSEFIGDDGNAFYETYQPDKLGELPSSDANGGGGASVSGLSGAAAVGSGQAGEGSAMRPMYHHKDLITRVIRLDKPYLYLTASKDGSVRTWNANTMQFQSIVTTGKNWLTDCCVMRRSNRLAVASMNRTLGFYDLNSNALIGEITEYSKRQCIPLCLEYVEKPADDREALVVGDDTGGITVMTCSDQWIACDGRSNGGTTAASSVGAGSSITSSTLNNPTNAAGSASLEAQGFLSRTKFKKHRDWVTRVKWVNDIRAIVATSLDTNISIIDVDRMTVKFEYNRHKKGVFDLVWCSSTRLIASCGMERDISIWNPYSSQRAVATLRGHTSSVLHLVSDDDNYQIISVASDNTFKVWDVRNHRCLQTWVDRYKSTGGAENRISSLLFDPKQPCLVSGTTHLTRWPFKLQHDDEQEDEEIERPMCIATYNAVFHQVVTAEMSAESVVKTWSAETGDEICSFSNAHGQSPVTAISFDYPGRRLLTGSHDGTLLKMWNFSNGALVKQFLKQEETPNTASTGERTSTLVAATASSRASASVLPKASSSATATLTLSDDLSFLGLGGSGNDKNSDEEDEDVRSSAPNGLKKTPATQSVSSMTSTSPRKRKVRDIMLLPPTFGIDWEGRKNANLAGYSELPSPTRARLNSKAGNDRERLYPRETFRPNPPDGGSDGSKGSEPTPPSTDAPGDSERTPRSRNSMSNTNLLRTLCEKEVTSILDIERNLRVGMGDYICQRFVCSVGWDRNLFIWADKNDESEALPVHVLPNPKTAVSQPGKCHTMDILALVYIPPAYIATAGLDGKILLWSINSGEFLSKVYQSQGSIDTMWYAQKIEMLFASGETGQLVCIDRSMTPRAVIPLEHPNNEAVTALKLDRTNTHLVTGDITGHIKLWDLAIAAEHDGLVLEICAMWRLGPGRVLGVDFVEHVRVNEPYLLLSCANGDVSMWTLDGIHIGCFGKHRIWQLGRPATYQASESSCMWPPRPTAEPGRLVTAEILPVKHSVKCFSIAALNGYETARETFLLEDSMPKPGEVWVCVSGHRARTNLANAKKQEIAAAAAPPGSAGGESSIPSGAVPAMFRRSSNNNASFILRRTPSSREKETLASMSVLQQRLSELAGDVIDIITVVKVTRGEISCWDGNGHKPPLLKVIEMSDFVRKVGWIKQPLLTQYIGRLFVDDLSHFRVSGISLAPTDEKSDRKVFWMVDTHGQDHPMRPLNEAISMARLKLHSSAPTTPLMSQSSARKQSKPSLLTKSSTTTPGIKGTDGRIGSTSIAVDGNDALADDEGGDEVPDANETKFLHALPLIKPKEKRVMGGLLPKRSSVRMRHDQSVDFRRVHAPEDIPKNFRVALQNRLQSVGNQLMQSSASSNNNKDNSSRSSRGASRFDGIIPE